MVSCVVEGLVTAQLDGLLQFLSPNPPGNTLGHKHSHIHTFLGKPHSSGSPKHSQQVCGTCWGLISVTWWKHGVWVRLCGSAVHLCDYVCACVYCIHLNVWGRYKNESTKTTWRWKANADNSQLKWNWCQVSSLWGSDAFWRVFLCKSYVFVCVRSFYYKSVLTWCSNLTSHFTAVIHNHAGSVRCPINACVTQNACAHKYHNCTYFHIRYNTQRS